MQFLLPKLLHYKQLQQLEAALAMHSLSWVFWVLRLWFRFPSRSNSRAFRRLVRREGKSNLEFKIQPMMIARSNQKETLPVLFWVLHIFWVVVGIHSGREEAHFLSSKVREQ